MKKSFRFTFMSVALIGAYLLTACGGTLPQSAPSDVAQKVQAKEIVFTGVVEQINGNEWVVSGQKFTVDPAAAMDSGIAVGDIVKVEGTVSTDGSVVALKVESSIGADDNSNSANANDDNANDDNSNGNLNSNDDNSNGDDNSNTSAADDSEVFGVVEAVTADSLTIGGVTYLLADFTEFNDAISVGDQVKIHVIVNADGTFTIREIEKSDDLGGDDNSNSGNTNDDNSNDDNGNGNSNDDSGGDNGNDDDSGQGGGDDNGNDGNDD